MKHFFITAVPSHFGIAVPGLLTAAAVLVLAGCQASSNTALMRYPRDLVIEASTGSLLPGRDNYALTITADGKGRFIRYRPDDLGPPFEETTFAVHPDSMEVLWSAINDQDFFALEERYVSEDVQDGSFAVLTITAEGRTRRVEVRNASVPPFDRLIEIINRSSPPGADLRY